MEDNAVNNNDSASSKNEAKPSSHQHRRTHIWAHRGLSARFPENTLPAFQAALEVGVDGIEFDIHKTKDGQIVVMHDPRVKRTTNGTGYISELTLAQLKLLDAGKWKGEAFIGYQVPTLAEVLDLVSHWSVPVTLNIESKSGVAAYPNIEVEAWRMVQEYQLESQVLFSSFNHFALRDFKQACTDAPVAPLYWEGLVDPWVYAQSLGAVAIHPFKYAFDHRVVEACHQSNVKVHTFGVDDARTAKRLMKWGVDAIITNRPDVLLQL